MRIFSVILCGGYGLFGLWALYMTSDAHWTAWAIPVGLIAVAIDDWRKRHKPLKGHVIFYG